MALLPAQLLGVFIGVLARTVLPYLVKLYKNPRLKWDNRYLLSAGAGLVLALILTTAMADSLRLDPAASFLTTFSVGFTLHHLSRELHKLFES